MTAPLSGSARAMIERAVTDERSLRAGDARRSRLKRAVLSGVAAASTGLLSSTGQAAIGVKAWGGIAQLLPLAKGLGVGLLLSGAVAGSLHLAAPPSSPPPPALTRSSPGVAVKRAELPVVGGQAAPPSPVATGESSAPPRARLATATTVRASSSEPSAPPGSALRAELELMSQVQAALRDNRGAYALVLLEHYDDTFPRGQLGTERLAAEVFAACQVGDVARARRAATQFLQRDASSSLAGRVKKACIDSERDDDFPSRTGTAPATQ